MREILFRGKRIDNGEWVYGDLIQLHDGRKFIVNNKHGACIDGEGNFINTEAPFVCEVLRKTIGQYTGQTDKAGTKAFEHDCIRALHGDAIGVIRYGESNNAFDGYELPYHIGFFVDWVSGEDKDMLRKDLGYWIKRVEVIGNIHDNTELLEGGADSGD